MSPSYGRCRSTANSVRRWKTCLWGKRSQHTEESPRAEGPYVCQGGGASCVCRGCCQEHAGSGDQTCQRWSGPAGGAQDRHAEDHMLPLWWPRPHFLQVQGRQEHSVPPTPQTRSHGAGLQVQGQAWGSVKAKCKTQSVGLCARERGGGEQEDEDASFNTVDKVDTPSPPIIIKVKLDDCLVDMEVDTGTSISLMSEWTFNKMWPGRTLQPSTLTLRTYLKETIPVVGLGRRTLCPHNSEHNTRL